MKNLLLCLLLLGVAMFAKAPVKTRPDAPDRRENKTKRAATARNLLFNGGAEKGSGKTPDGWSTFDGLVTQWLKDGGNPGKCVLIKTDVLQVDKQQFLQSEEDFRKRKPGVVGKSNQYSTVGAHEGGWAYLPPYDIQDKDQYFILSVDVLSPAKGSELFYPQIFIRGFQKVTEVRAGQDETWFHEYYGDGIGYSDVFGPKKIVRKSRVGDYLMCYRHTLACRCFAPGEYQHFELGFKVPSMPKFRPERLLVKCYAMWPLGEYKFDNIALRRSTAKEVKAVNDARPSINHFMP